jgi:hypothetical protein
MDFRDKTREVYITVKDYTLDRIGLSLQKKIEETMPFGFNQFELYSFQVDMNESIFGE